MGSDNGIGYSVVVDLLQLYSDHYAATDEPTEVCVPPRPYLMVEVTDPGLADLAMLRRTATELNTYAAAGPNRYSAMPIEGYWWCADHEAYDPTIRGPWHWIAAICLPPSVSDQAVRHILGGGDEIEMIPSTPARPDSTIANLRAAMAVKMYGDGPAVQAVHYGQPEDAHNAIRRIHRYIDDHGYQPTGFYHEIYLTDRTRTSSGEIETIVRQPILRPCDPHD